MKRRLISRSILGILVMCIFVGAHIGTSCTYRTLPANSAKDDERLIYSAIINEYLGPQPGVVLIGKTKLSYSRPNYGLGEIETDPRISHLKEFYPSVAEDTLRDFDSKHLVPTEFDADFTLPFEFVLIDVSQGRGRESTQDNLSDWNNIVSFSAIGFNKDRTEAFLFAQRECAPLCGQGDHFFLIREDGNWKIREVFAGWRT